MEQQTNFQASEPLTIRLAPLPFWKWSIAIFLLLVIPLVILFQQANVAFISTAEMARNELGQNIDTLSSRIALELDTNTQLREIINNFSLPYSGVLQRQYYLSNFRRLCLIPLPVEAVIALQGIELAHHRARLLLEKHLRRVVPGVRLIKWDSDYRILPDNDEVFPRWAYRLIVAALQQRLSRGDKHSDRSYLDNISGLTRNFLDSNKMTMFLKSTAEVFEFSDAAGHRLALYWERVKIHSFSHNNEPGGGLSGCRKS